VNSSASNPVTRLHGPRRPYLLPQDLDHLVPGVLDEAAVNFFSNGHCASMALAIHRLTGWEIAHFRPLCGCYPGHAVVVPERGCYADAEGPGAWFRYQSTRGDKFFTRFLQISEIEYALPHLELVFPFARAVLDRYFPNWMQGTAAAEVA
jgi:hypothetical protein